MAVFIISVFHISCRDAFRLQPAGPTRPRNVPVTARILYAQADYSGSPSKYGIFSCLPDGTDRRVVINDEEYNAYPDWSPDRTRIVFLRNSGLCIINPDGTGLIPITDPMTDDLQCYTPRWSPDGSKVLFSAWHPMLPTADLYTVNADGTGLVRLTFTDTFDDVGADPDGSPDGTRIVYVRTDVPWTTSSLRIMNSDGTGDIPLIDTDAFMVGEPRWSPDGAWILFDDRRSLPGPHLIRPDGTGDHRITDQVMSYLSWSPDGSRIAGKVMGDGTVGDSLATVCPDGSGYTILFTEADYLSYSIFDIDWD